MDLRTLRVNQRALGFGCGTRWTILRSANYRGWIRNSVRVHPSQLDHPVTVRMGTSSDPDVFDQLFLADELAFAKSLSNIRTIVDLGANVGFASARFLSAFHDSKVIAVEPDPDNAAICRANLAPYGSRARLIEGGVWHTSGGLMLVRGAFRDGREWTTQVRSARADETPDTMAYDIDSLTQEPIDLLKIDIEGSEQALFSLNTGWLDRVRHLCIELHGPECEKAVLDALSIYRCTVVSCGEYRLFLDLHR